MAKTKGKQVPKATSAPRSKRRRTKGALAAIGALLLASALVRVGIGASEAFAKEDVEHTTAKPTHERNAQTGSSTIPQGERVTIEAPDGSRVITEADIDGLVESLLKREARVIERERAIAMHMQAIKIAEEEIAY